MRAMLASGDKRLRGTSAPREQNSENLKGSITPGKGSESRNQIQGAVTPKCKVTPEQSKTKSRLSSAVRGDSNRVEGAGRKYLKKQVPKTKRGHDNMGTSRNERFTCTQSPQVKRGFLKRFRVPKQGPPPTNGEMKMGGWRCEWV